MSSSRLRAAARAARGRWGGPGPTGDGDTDEGQRATDVGEGGRRLAEEHHAHHDRDRRDEVGGHAQAAGVHVLQREGVGRERDGGREHAEVDEPPRGRRRRRRDLVDELAGERQADERADRAGQPGDVDRGQPTHERLLQDQADRVGDGAEQAEQHADDVATVHGVARASRGRERDQRHAAEGQGQAEGEVEREPLVRGTSPPGRRSAPVRPGSASRPCRRRPVARPR